MKKILFIHHAAGWGGAPNSMIKLINSLNKNDFHVQVLLLKNSIVANKLKENNIEYYIAQSRFYEKYYSYFVHHETGYVKWYQPYKFIKLLLCWIFSRYLFASKELRRFKSDIIHLNSSVLTDWLAPAKKKAKVIIHIREPFRKGRMDFLYYFFTNQMKKYADRIISISEDNAKRVGLLNKTKIIYNYANIPQTLPPETSYTSKKVLYLGGSEQIKGFHTMVAALDYLDKDVKVYFGGAYKTKSKKNIIKYIVKKLLGIGKRKILAIEKLSKHPNAEIIGLTNNVDRYLNEICCLASPFSKPHFARPVIEANLHKKPAIGSNIEGMDEIIEHNITGLLFEKDNPKALAESINYLTSHAEKAKEMGEKAWSIAQNKFSPANIDLFKAIYNTL